MLNSWFTRLLAKWRAGITNQGIDIRSLKHTMSRQRQRREGFIWRSQTLTREFGYNLPRKVRRRIAWDNWREEESGL